MKKITMVLRFGKLAIKLTYPKHPSYNSAVAVQELLGDKFGEISTIIMISPSINS